MKKQLIIFSYDFPPSDGGIARLCQEISIEAKSHYESVTVLTRKKNGVNTPYNNDQTIVIQVANKRGKCEIECFNYLRKIKEKGDYDILCGLWHPEGIIAFISGFKNVFVLAHGTELLAGRSKFRKKLWLPLYAKLILKKAKGIIANSHYTESLVKNISKRANSRTIPLAVNHNFFCPNKKRINLDTSTLNICTISRIHKFKGHDFVIQTISKLPNDYKTKIKYNIGGTGTYLPKLKELVQELNLSEIVKFYGFIKDEDLPLFYNANDLFILCTREEENSTQVEGFGLVFLEAQACGIPVIGAKTGGIPDAIEDGNGGWLIEQDNRTELSNLLINLIDNPSTIKEEGNKARIRVEREATWQYYCNKLFKYMN